MIRFGPPTLAVDSPGDPMARSRTERGPCPADKGLDSLFSFLLRGRKKASFLGDSGKHASPGRREELHFATIASPFLYHVIPPSCLWSIVVSKGSVRFFCCFFPVPCLLCVLWALPVSPSISGSLVAWFVRGKPGVVNDNPGFGCVFMSRGGHREYVVDVVRIVNRRASSWGRPLRTCLLIRH